MTTNTHTSFSDTKRELFPSDSKRKKPNLVALLVGFGLVLVCLIGLFTSSSPAAAGLWSIGLMLVLMFLSVPVAIALAVPAIVGVYVISGTPAAANVLANAPFEVVSQWSMSVLPMFIFMGLLLTQSGLSTRIYRTTDLWFSWLPGGIGVGTTVAGAGLASVSGSTIGMTYALGRAGIPEMLRAGYDKRMAVGTVIVSGLPGHLIPPSIMLIIYAGIASVPVGPQLVAGVVPGILIAVTFGLFIFLVGLFVPRLVGRSKGDQHVREKVTWTQRFKSLGGIWGLVLIMGLLFGGMFSGVFTPTEAGAAAALTALLLTLFYTRKDKPLAKLAQSAFATVSATAAIFFIIIGAELLTNLLAITGLATTMTDFITGLGLNRIGFLILLIFVYIIMGMFFETVSMLLLTIPILLPTLEVMDISPVWFGVFVVILCEIGQLTPPVGILSYIVHNICKAPEVNLGQDITLKDIFTSLVWFLPIVIIFLSILIAVPQMTEWLPAVLERAQQ